MKRKISLLALLTIAIAGFLALTTASPSFAASQANKAGVSFSMSGQYIGKAFWSQNQSQLFTTTGAYPNSNSFEVFLQRLRMNGSISYDKLAHGMPLAAIFTQFDLTNAYNGVTNGYGTNGWQALGYTTVPTGFNHDFNTFGLRQAYIRFITPIGAIMFGRMPVKFGLGVAVNTNADGVGDFIPLGNVGVFVGNLFGNETTAWNNGNTPTPIGALPPALYGYSHIQSGTIPTLEVMSLKPMNDVSWSAWLTEAHLNQFGAVLSSFLAANAALSPTPPSPGSQSLLSESASANITYGGLSATYANKGTNVAGEFDYFRGDIMNSPYAFYNNATTDDRTKIGSYDLYLTGSQLLNTSTPTTVGLKFGIGGPISYQHLDMTYYSQIQNTRTLFGDVIGNNWQSIQLSAPGIDLFYNAPGEAMGTNLANRYTIMVDATEHFTGMNDLQESLIHAAWLKKSINGTDMFGGNDIGTEFDLNFTHHFTKTLAWQAWGAYVWTGSGVESATTPAPNPVKQVPGNWFAPNQGSNNFANASHKDITAIGTAIIWNF
ncbi:MAG: hypothetical protein EVJ47_00405 [Candidatus Acidulodesulfobacterium ferriphilum]|uniref:Uncharacterized protein n=1 Tax=Candidatus Acidulodesulfobacterium ferriphilum TaxID=2597223 RepID=A0A519BC31_9DELT|nr:MAG: hypothetical protein EVJ47_00405 [Candidatus Acidulodesulfobacterium ferriphilum]